MIYYLFSISSVHENITTDQDINDVILTTPSEQDNETNFETPQNGKSITSFHYDNKIMSSIHSQMMKAPTLVQIMRLK